MLNGHAAQRYHHMMQADSLKKGTENNCEITSGKFYKQLNMQRVLCSAYDVTKTVNEVP